jgi:hypothetical protein
MLPCPLRYCVTADYFESTNTTAGKPWGWNDQNCILKYAYICKYWPGEGFCQETEGPF